MSANIRVNIINLYLIKFSKWFNLIMPVIVLFYQDNGLSMQDIFWLKSIYSVAIVVMEIPSGYLADVWGRKKTLLLGGILGASGFALYSFSFGFLAFAIAEIILGIGHSFVSGADSAMLYDTLKSSNRNQEYIKQEGWITSAGNFAEAIAGVCGGLLATLSLRLPFYVQFGVAAVAIPAALFLREPKTHAVNTKKKFSSILRTVKQTFCHRQLRSALMVSSFTGTASLTFAWFVQPYFQEAGLPISLFGVMWTLLNLSVGVSSMFSYKAERLLGQRNSLLVIIIGLSLGYFLAAWEVSLAGIGMLFFFYTLRGIAHPILKDYINRYTQSDVRATILSLRNFVIRINFAIIGPLLGYFTDRFSLRVALLVAGLGYLLSGLAGMLPLWRESIKEKDKAHRMP
ncbi:MFS transporter [Gaoshiqia sediminis]|uniref:MFS transporter n=1 Tax=Gaoshiqia sediminis TaxID=2986998 RepID=A0AA42CAX6_9BACT|nr:MFS transporter [Gaoshiqia sediminis]MCW0484160.1 MFS transporter [Gaoshiqia sediminis]